MEARTLENNILPRLKGKNTVELTRHAELLVYMSSGWGPRSPPEAA